jgi:glycosyltransferase involved in cell wall biosynthesis
MNPLTPQPLISIALCTYNGERFLKEQLDSLLWQDYPHFEIVAVDDASGDGTVEILREYAQRDPRLRYQRNPANLGFRKNFEVALQGCRGELIAMCDQDDIWLPDKLSTLVDAMLKADAVLAYSDSELIDEQGNSLGRRIRSHIRIEAYADPLPYLFEHQCSGHAALLRREVVERGSPIPCELYHDWWLAFVAVSIGKVAYVDRCLVRYRRHGESVTFCIDTGPEDRARGFRDRQLHETEIRLAAFAGFPGREQAFFRRLFELWRQRDDAILSPRLAGLMLRYRDRLYPNDAPRRRRRLAMKYFWGLRLKRWLEPNRYARRQTG